MKVSALLLTFAFVCFLATFSSADEGVFSPVPLIMWGNNIQSIQNLETTNEQRLQEIVTETINELCQQNEVVIIFIEPKLRTEQLWESHAFLNLNNKVKSGATVFPYIAAGRYGVAKAVSQSVAPISSRVILAKNFARGAFSELSGVERVSLNSLAGFLETSDIFTNGVTDVVIVYFDDLEIVDLDNVAIATYVANDAFVGAIVDTIEKKSNGKYAAMFTADKPYVSAVSRVPKEIFELEWVLRSMNAPSNTSGNYSSYFPTMILEVYICVIVLMAILIVGVCCTCSLQTPGRFENPHKIKKDL